MIKMFCQKPGRNVNNHRKYNQKLLAIVLLDISLF